MANWRVDWAGFEEDTEEFEARALEADLEIPDVFWADDIAKIEDPRLRNHEIRAAQKIVQQERELSARMESEGMDPGTREVEILCSLMPKKRVAATRSALANVGLTYDHLGDIAEDQQMLCTGNPDLLDRKVDLLGTISEMGPDRAQELADRMLEEEGISDEAHESISRQVRLSRLARK